MRGHMKKILATTGLAALAACGQGSYVSNSSYGEAGFISTAGPFGNATMNNTMIMSGERSYTYELASRFAAEVLTNVNFAFNSAQLDAGARDTLREQARWIRQFPEARFRVYGHTDAVGSDRYNKSLGMRRANAVVAYLTSQGISRSRLEAVASFGETQPIIVTEGRERRNRRTVTEVSGFVEDHPSVIDGKYAAIVYREYVNSAVPRSGLTGISGDSFKTD